MAEPWTCPDDRFPVLEDRGYGKRKLTVPLALVAEHERQAQANHSQSVARLKERGGLSWCELAAVLGDRRWERMDPDHAHETTMRHVLLYADRLRREKAAEKAAHAIPSQGDQPPAPDHDAPPADA